MIDKLHRTLNSLLKKHYTVEFWTDNNFTIMLSFYHLNSVYNGLCYISKNTGHYSIDFQYHRYNKTVHKQMENICKITYKLYQLGHLDMLKTILDNYHSIAREIYDNNYSITDIYATAGGEN